MSSPPTGPFPVGRPPPPARPASHPATAEHLPGADASTGLRNLLYAFQWWVFGLFAIFMWWRWLMEDVLGRARPGAAGDAG